MLPVCQINRYPHPALLLAWFLILIVGCGTQETETPRWTPPVGKPFEVNLTGRDYEWHIDYPGEDFDLGTEDDVHVMRHLHLPVGTRIKLKLTSDDYLYSFTLPHLGVREIAVPELVFTIEFETRQAGGFELLGDQMCGYAHPELMGNLIIHSQADFGTWLRESRAARADD